MIATSLPSAPPRTGWRWAALLALLLAVTGCASLPQVSSDTREAQASEAIPLSPATTLGRITQISQPAPELSGFRLMPLGTFSLDTRVQLARRAEVSLDVQYYHFENDETGRYLIRALTEAAQRGVRVRLLIDDFYTGGEDDFFLGFAAHKNVQVRLYNPFCCARGQGHIGIGLGNAQNVPKLLGGARSGDREAASQQLTNGIFPRDGAAVHFPHFVGGMNSPDLGEAFSGDPGSVCARRRRSCRRRAPA